MIDFPCQRCRTMLRAKDAQAGQLIKCPACFTAMRVPERARAAAAAQPTRQSAAQPSAPPPAPKSAPESATATQAVRNFTLFTGLRAPGRRYGFNCVYCSSRLEANESMAAQEGQCPTCGSQITIPILDRFGRLIDPKTKEIIKQAPHPVHAYAAAGDRAPGIIRREDGTQVIKCPRCGAVSPVTCNNCKSCGLPFTMEGTMGGDSSGAANGFCVASMVLGIIGIPAACTIVPSVLAVLFGIIGLSQIKDTTGDSGKGMAIGGIACGLIGGLLAAMWRIW